MSEESAWAKADELEDERDRLRAAIQDVEALVELHAWGEEDPLDARDRLIGILRGVR